MDVSNQSNGRLQNSSFEHPVNGLDNMYTVRDVEIIQTSDVHEAKDSNENEDSNYLEEYKCWVWEPPEPHDPEVDGVASYEEGGESWVEVIASLSWEAASLLKPDAVVAKARDLLYTHAHTHSQWTRSSSTSSALNLCPVIASSNRSVIYLAVLELTLQVLLKIAQSDALKVKSVVQCAVFLAYHLILETAFFVDQRATLSYADVATDLPTDTETLTLGSINSRVPHNTDTSAENESDAVDILISNESHEGCSDSSTLEFKGNSTFDVPHNPALLSGFSSISVALRKVMGKGYRYEPLFKVCF
ncbi:hypothetical protein DVH24_037627 [Malus domestica]|uniref:Uncharacterized protein n=1 Tax=Malus domestica TaxID=3750 RepID=A0A498J1Y0_MALDO|nr:hypothetical protein DVH24_037627 [Malus domestica]